MVDNPSMDKVINFFEITIEGSFGAGLSDPGAAGDIHDNGLEVLPWKAPNVTGVLSKCMDTKILT